MAGMCRIDRSTFGLSPELLLTFGELKVLQFRFASGVEALKVAHPEGHVVLLPYQGQQIWDAVFFGRSLRMVNFFDQPEPTNDLLDSYGAFLYHCGARRMGAPGPDDDHPLHGELPGAQFDNAWLEFGTKDGRNFVSLTGVYRYTRAFGDKYTAQPTVRVFEDSCVMDVSMEITNQMSKPMEMMYMCHINFAPGDNAEIVQTAGWNSQDMEIRSSIPSHVVPTPEFLASLEELKNDPGKTRILRPEDSYDPEVVYFMKNQRSDDDGFTHMMQRHTDGTADYVSYRPEQLDHTVRWILINEDQKVNAMALPATSGPEGYTREREKGTVKTIQPGERKKLTVRVGALDSSKSAAMQAKIESLVR